MSNSVLVSGVNRRSVADNVPMSSQLPMSSIPMSSQMPMSPAALAAAQARQQPAASSSTKVHVHALPGANPSRRGRRTVILAAAGALAAVALGAGLWLQLGRSARNKAADSSAIPTTAATLPNDAALLATPVPSMAGVELKGKDNKDTTFTYIIDRSGCSAQVFADMLRTCDRSMETLAPAANSRFW